MKLVETMKWAQANLLQMELIEMMMMVGENLACWVNMGNKWTWDIADEDRISTLPLEMIHRILSYMDTRNVIETNALSKIWQQIWTSMPYLNFNNKVLLHRNKNANVFKVELTCKGETNMFHWLTNNAMQFSSHTGEENRCCVPKFVWALSSLETLELSTMHLCDTTNKSLDLFPKCENLKYITLKHISTSSLAVFIVVAPKLSNLSLKHFRAAPNVFKVVSPQLENMTLCIGSWGFGSLQFMEGLASL
ncbi:hypothetical protein OSB04_030421 [Centaurea solstitialis]|uniref:F-box domain-containing protein n=1 Tax=Centaurea solstitialis TaxID=347529 RepID=A0AA38S8F3_9ASTR|nr:hypothetical protein OSB04_030421 [Centaurea solstitialis]